TSAIQWILALVEIDESILVGGDCQCHLVVGRGDSRDGWRRSAAAVSPEAVDLFGNHQRAAAIEVRAGDGLKLPDCLPMAGTAPRLRREKERTRPGPEDT